MRRATAVRTITAPPRLFNAQFNGFCGALCPARLRP
jgi:hypothetical protein